MHINSSIPFIFFHHIIISIMTYANSQRPTQRLYACGTNPSFIIIIINSLRNYWNHRLLLSVTPRRAHDVPRRSHPNGHPTFQDHFQSRMAHDLTAHTLHGHTVLIASFTPTTGIYDRNTIWFTQESSLLTPRKGSTMFTPCISWCMPYQWLMTIKCIYIYNHVNHFNINNHALALSPK